MRVPRRTPPQPLDGIDPVTTDEHPGARSRRQFLALGGALALGSVVAACGGDDNPEDSDGSGDPAGSDSSGTDGAASDGGTGTPSNPTGDVDGFIVVQRYPSGQRITPGEVRLAFSIANAEGSLLPAGPEVITGVIRNEQGETIDTIEAARRGSGLDVPYWAITTTIPARGLYEFALDGAVGDPTPFLVFDPPEVSIPAVGTPLPPFDTPTTNDARGVDPVCTRLDGPCPFHGVTLTEALAAGKPVVYLIGTPAHCATATCGPGLDFLIAAAEQYADVATFVHAEVYADPEATEVAPAVTAYTLDYEPVIWITDASGTVVRRIDIVWDAEELGEMLAESLA